MKKAVAIVFILALIPAAAFAQWSVNFNYGWLDNASPEWKVFDHNSKPFSIWGNGWQVGGGVEYHKKSWLSVGGSCCYQSFSTEPSGKFEKYVSESDGWSGEASWQVPVEAYARLFRPRALLQSNLKLGLGVMVSHVGRLMVTTTGVEYSEGSGQWTSIVNGTGETLYRPFGEISAGINIPITARLGITLDYGYLSTFDRMVQELPFQLGMNIKW